MTLFRLLQLAQGVWGPSHPKVTEERLKARANWAQTVGLAIFGLSFLTPLFNSGVRFSPLGATLGGIVTGLLLVVNQVVLGYIPDPSATPAKEPSDVE